MGQRTVCSKALRHSSIFEDIPKDDLAGSQRTTYEDSDAEAESGGAVGQEEK